MLSRAGSGPEPSGGPRHGAASLLQGRIQVAGRGFRSRDIFGGLDREVHRCQTECLGLSPVSQHPGMGRKEDG